MSTAINRQRSAGRSSMEWREIPRSDPRTDKVGLEPLSHMYESTKTKCTLIISHSKAWGWHMSIAHPWRRPTWDEIASARYEMIPTNLVMAMMLPPEDEYVNVHEHCFQLWECRCPR